jgi:putative spermidine/putrescine transport system permease protein
VTVTDALLAFPIAMFMAKVASRRVRGLLVVGILMPLWASYLVKVYAWRVILSEDGILNWALGPLGIKGPGFGFVATWLVFSYLWLPYMILPIYAGLERIPRPCSTPRATSAGDRARPFAASCCRWPSRPSSPGRSSPSR